MIYLSGHTMWLWDLNSLTKDWTQATAVKCQVLTTGPPRNFLFIYLMWLLEIFKLHKHWPRASPVRICLLESSKAMSLTLWFCNDTSGIFLIANTFSEGGKEIEIEVLFRVIEVFVKKRVIVNPKLEENLSCFLKDIFSNISFFYF